MNVGSQLSIGFEELSKREWEKLRRDLSFAVDGDPVLCYKRLLSRRVYKIPRGALNMIPSHVERNDLRSLPAMPRVDYNFKLDDIEKDPRFSGQSQAVLEMARHEQGLVIRPPGTGKTKIALAFAAQCGTRTLVLVHTKDILDQWLTAAKEGLPGVKIGVIHQGKCSIGHITIAMVQTLNRRYMEKPRSWWQQFGCVIADEAHHVSAPSWEAVLNKCYAHFRFGFTASETRADGMHPTMKFIIGPVIHKMKFTSAVELRVEPLYTGFRRIYRSRHDWMPLLKDLVEDGERNARIAEVIDREVAEGNSVLVLSRRIDHLGRIAALADAESEILTGVRSRTDRARILGDFRRGKVKCLLATQLADEALDVPRLNRVILTFPGKHEGRIIQQIGRALRTHESKTDAVIYDCVDDVGVLRHQWNQRQQTYNQNRIPVNSPMKKAIKKARRQLQLWR